MGRYRTDKDLIDKINELEARLSKLERTPQASSMGVNIAGITVQGGSVTTRRDPIAAQGLISTGSNNSVNGEVGMSHSIQRSNSVKGDDHFTDGTTVDGNIAMQVGTVDGGHDFPGFAFPTLVLYDKSGSPLVADSGNARRGFSDPVLHQSFTDGTYFSSTSTTFSFIMSAEWYMYHPHCRIRVIVQNDAANSSELRVSENGGNNSILVTPIGLGAFQYVDLIVRRSSMVSGVAPNGNVAALNLEHRRVTGAGTIRTQIISVVGIDLSASQPF